MQKLRNPQPTDGTVYAPEPPCTEKRMYHVDVAFHSTTFRLMHHLSSTVIRFNGVGDPCNCVLLHPAPPSPPLRIAVPMH